MVSREDPIDTGSPLKSIRGWVSRQIDERLTATSTHELQAQSLDPLATEITPSVIPSEGNQRDNGKDTQSIRTRKSIDPDGIHSVDVPSMETFSSLQERTKTMLATMESARCDALSQSSVSSREPPAQTSSRQCKSEEEPLEPIPIESVYADECHDASTISDEKIHRKPTTAAPKISATVGGGSCTFVPQIEGFDHPYLRGWIGPDMSDLPSKYRFYAVKEGYDPGIYSSSGAAWIRTVDFQVNTQSPKTPKGVPSLYKGFNRYSEAVAFLGWDPSIGDHSRLAKYRPPRRISQFRDGPYGPDPHYWGTTGLVSDTSTTGTQDPDDAHIQAAASAAQALSDTQSASSDPDRLELRHRHAIQKIKATDFPELIKHPSRTQLGKWEMVFRSMLSHPCWLVDDRSILTMTDDSAQSDAFKFRSQQLCQILIQRLAGLHYDIIQRFHSLVTAQRGVALFHSVLHHLHPNTDNSAFNEFEEYTSRVQQNGETVFALACDLELTWKRLNGIGLDISRKSLGVRLLLAVLHGAYGKHEAFTPLRHDIHNKKFLVSSVDFHTLQSDLHDMMRDSGLVVNGAARKLPASAVARRVGGGSSSSASPDAWIGQLNLDPLSVEGLFNQLRCPLCRIPKGSDQHWLADCPVAKSFGFSIRYDKDKDSRRKRQSNSDKARAVSTNASTESPAPSSADRLRQAKDAVAAASREVTRIQKEREQESASSSQVTGSAKRVVSPTGSVPTGLQPFVDVHKIKDYDSDSYMHNVYDALRKFTHTDTQNCRRVCIGTCRAGRNISDSTSQNSDTLVADSGATSDMFRDRSHFETDYRTCSDSFVYMGDGSAVNIAGFGSVRFKINGKVIHLRNVLHVPSLECSLLSITRHGLRGKGCSYLVENGMSHLSFPDFVLSLPIPANGDPRFTLEPLLPSDNGACDYTPDTITHHLDTFDTRLRYLHHIHRGRVTTRSKSKNNIKALKSLIESMSDPSSVRKHRPTDAVSAPDDSSLTESELRKSPQTVIFDAPPQYSVESARGSTPERYSRSELESLFGGRQLHDFKILTKLGDGLRVTSNRNGILSVGRLVNRRRGRRNRRSKRTLLPLSTVGMDIGYGPSASPGGFKFVLVLVDHCTSYTWIYGMHGTSGADIQEALWKFFVDAGGFPARIQCDFDPRFLGGKAMTLLRSHGCRVQPAPPNRQSQNGMVERRWQILQGMARSFLTDARLPRKFWYWAVREAVSRLNILPISSNLANPTDPDSLTTPFEAYHGSQPDYRILFPFGCLGSFRRTKDGTKSRDTFDSQGLLGIALGRSEFTNGMIFYNPTLDSFTTSADYLLDKSRSIGEVFPSIRYDGGLTTSILSTTRKDTPTKFSINDPVFVLDDTNDVQPGTVVSPPTALSKYYTVKLESGATMNFKPDQLFREDSVPDTGTPSVQLGFFAPKWMTQHAKITLVHEGTYRHGYLHLDPKNFWEFVTRDRDGNLTDTVPLPDLPYSWKQRICEGTLVLGWQDDPDPPILGRARHVSAAQLTNPIAPASLEKGTNPRNPDADVWKAAYDEEYDGLKNLNTFTEISEDEYQDLVRRHGDAAVAIPTMNLFTVKKDERGKPVRAKSRIVVLGNLEKRIWEKSDRYAPVINSASNRLLVSMAVESGRVLKQGDCKNAFCQPDLPDDEITICRPPKGCPRSKGKVYWRLNKTLYGLARSARHWYKRFSSVLLSLGFEAMPQDPCVFKCTPFPGEPPIYVGMYVDDFVYFSQSDKVEQWFETNLSSKVKVDFMGAVSWFLGCSYDWQWLPDGRLTCHISQQAYVEHLLDKFGMEECVASNRLFRQGLPIDRIDRTLSPDTASVDFIRQYQSIMGGLIWLVTSTRPDISVATKLLGQFNSKPSRGHMEAAKYVLRYLKGTSSHGIWFTQGEDRLAGNVGLPPSLDSKDTLSFTDSCWGPQDASKPREHETRTVRIDEMHSIQGHYITRMGGAILWGVHREKRISGSSCMAEIKAMDNGTKDIQFIRHLMTQLGLPDTDTPTPLLNDNRGSVDWANNGGITSKKLRHENIGEMHVMEAKHHGEIDIHWIPGKDNPADLFTKEHKDLAQFTKLRDLMVRPREWVTTLMPSTDQPYCTKTAIKAKKTRLKHGDELDQDIVFFGDGVPCDITDSRKPSLIGSKCVRFSRDSMGGAKDIDSTWNTKPDELATQSVNGNHQILVGSIPIFG